MEIFQEGYNRKEYCSVKEAAGILGVTTKTIRNRIADGRIRAGWNEIGVGKSQWLIKRSDLVELKAAEEAAKMGKSVVASSEPTHPAQLETFTALLEEKTAAMQEELQAIRQSQERLERLLIEKDEQLRALIEEKKRPWWKVW